MNLFHILVCFTYCAFSSVLCDKSCSRERSRIVRDYFTQALHPIYERHRITIPNECIFSSQRDIFYQQELHKAQLSHEQWFCTYCNKTFTSEYHLDIHLGHRHNETLVQGEETVCLADYCLIFRCDVLKRSKISLRSINPFARGPGVAIAKFSNEQQFTILRSRCASMINQCIPHSIHHDTRVQIQHEMYAEVCAYLTTNKYFELPDYCKPLISFTAILSAAILLFACLLGLTIIRRSDWKFNEEEDESNKHLSDEAISSATALLSKTPANGIIHSSKSPATTTVRHRVRFESVD